MSPNRTRAAKRILVKIGSGVVTQPRGVTVELDRNTLYRLARELSALVEAGREVLLVSSGAVAMGLEDMAMGCRPDHLAGIQALAAVGQSQLMQLWRDAFMHHGHRVAQVLLTRADLVDRQRFLNVRGTLDTLLSWGVIPIINENDTVMTEEITFGDNDQLAGQVAKQMGVDLLVLMSTVEGLLDRSDAVVHRVAAHEDVQRLVRDEQTGTGRGGMLSKLQAAAAAVHGGIEVVLVSGKQAGTLGQALAGEAVGTRFESTGEILPSRKHWIAYTRQGRGVLHLDAGATAALVAEGASLLAVGISRVEGVFGAGDAVSLRDPEGLEVGRGLVRVDSKGLEARLAEDRPAKEQGHKGSPIVHRDDLVMWERIE